MSKAEEKGYEAYPYNGDYRGQGDSNSKFREAYIKGYEQAEKDLALTWEDFEIIHKITYDESRNVSLNKGGEISIKEFYQEVLNRFNKQKEDGNI